MVKLGVEPVVSQPNTLSVFDSTLTFDFALICFFAHTTAEILAQMCIYI